MTKLNKVLAIAGIALVAAGVGLGFRSVWTDDINCGSVFQPAVGITPMACDGRLARSSTLVAVVVAAGVVCVAGSFALKLVQDRVAARVEA